MSKEEIREFINKMEEETKRTANSKEECLQFLVNAGICTEAGELAEPYKS